MIREPVVAGQFYPDSPAQLRAMIKSFVKTGAEKEEVIGLVVPHAGYIYSGAVTGAVFPESSSKILLSSSVPITPGVEKPRVS